MVTSQKVGSILLLCLSCSFCGGKAALYDESTNTQVSSLDTLSQEFGAEDPSIVLPDTIVGTPRQGQKEDDKRTPRGPGLVLMGGGTDVDSAFIWAHDTIAGDKSSRRGDVVILRATGKDGYDAYLAGLAPFNSVQTLIISKAATRDDLNIAANLIDRAEFVFFAGGNQADYVAWKDSRLMKAVQDVYTRGGVVGGTSAGLAILGQFVFDSVAAGPNNVQSADALKNPYGADISFTRDMLGFPQLKSVLTDTHFRQRDRFGRLTAFMARQFADGALGDAAIMTGLGIDESTSVLVDATGKGILAPRSEGAAFFVRAGAASQASKGQPLEYPNVKVMRLDAGSQYFDFNKSCSTGYKYEITVDGSKSTGVTPSNVYTSGGARDTCP